MLPIIPAVLIASGAGLVAYEAFLKKKPGTVPGGTPGAPGAPGTPSSPVPGAGPMPGGPMPGGPTPGAPSGPQPMPPELRAAYQALLAASDNADPDQLDLVAGQLAQYGYVGEAAQLRAKAAEIRARRAGGAPSVPVIPPFVPPAMPRPTTPTTPANAGQTAVVTTSSDPLTLRDAPNGTPVGSLPRGASVMVIDWNGGAPTGNAPQGWAQVGYAGQVGFASKQFLQLGSSAPGAPAPAPSPAPGPATVQTARVTTASDPLTLRDAPNGGPVGSVPRGATVTVLNWNGGAPTSNSSQGWAQISYAGRTGFASKNFLALNAQVTTSGVMKTSEGGSRPVTCLAPEGCRIRATPSPNGKALAVFPNGETATLVRHVSGAKGTAGSPGPGGWCLVRWANFQGWVPSEWMRLS